MQMYACSSSFRRSAGSEAGDKPCSALWGGVSTCEDTAAEERLIAAMERTAAQFSSGPWQRRRPWCRSAPLCVFGAVVLTMVVVCAGAATPHGGADSSSSSGSDDDADADGAHESAPDIGAVRAVAEVDADITPLDFASTYAEWGVPVVLRGAARGWPALTTWSHEEFVRRSVDAC
jgi:hypothetical protein